MSPGDKQVQIVVTFKSSNEVDLRDSKEMYFNMFDSYKEELIAKIPVMINAKSVFSKYKFEPERGINFGPFQFGSKKTRTLTIKNEGEFDFK